MAVEKGQYPEIDLDRTDTLPILEGVLFDPDVFDDAVPLDRGTAPFPAAADLTAPRATSPGAATSGAAVRNAPASDKRPSDYDRPPIDLPSLAESMRSVEERIERQHTEYETLRLSHERTQQAEAAARARAIALERDLSAVRAALELERDRARDLERNLTEKAGALEAARTRAEQAVHDAEHYQSEARTLRESVASRDATIVQVLHSLGERDAQLSALQAEHAKMVPALEARAQNSTQLEKELNSVRAQLNTVSLELKASQEKAGNLGAQLTRNQSEISVVRSDLEQAKSQNASYLEVLRTRDWRSGFDRNLLLDLDEKARAAEARRAALTAERDDIQGRVADLEAMIAQQKASIEKWQSAAIAQASAAAHQAGDFEQAERQRSEWNEKLSAAEAEAARLTAELAARDRALAEAQTALASGLQRLALLHSEHTAKLTEHEAEATERDEEMTVLMAHLKEARRPVESIEGDARGLREDLRLKSLAVEELTQQADALKAALERTRGQLEEREFMIRRLERSESNNANVLGRIQTSMERLGVAASGTAAPAGEWSPQLIRIDGDKSISHTLGRRTRIGRAQDCELHIDSSGVSRHHALILAGTREAIIEDLNSTNGVILNGRKVTRQVLTDGDIVTIGEIQFRYVAKTAPASAKE
ncbi:MAG: FHA domain-containing protein [Pseudomonadota bacterium]|nr:FHA domain-containing protein [Pseudomonadota bacterium]